LRYSGGTVTGGVLGNGIEYLLLYRLRYVNGISNGIRYELSVVGCVCTVNRLVVGTGMVEVFGVCYGVVYGVVVRRGVVYGVMYCGVTEGCYGVVLGDGIVVGMVFGVVDSTGIVDGVVFGNCVVLRVVVGLVLRGVHWYFFVSR